MRNLPDGSVETRAEGEIESLNAYLEWLHAGPPSGRVDKVDVTQRGTCRASSGPFEIR